MAQVQRDQPSQAADQRAQIPVGEQVVGAIGLLLVVGMLVFLVYQALQPNTPPDLIITPEQTLATSGGYLVQIRVTNEGSSTAASVEIEGTLSEEGTGETASTIETSTVTFDYIPPHSSRQGGLFFQNDPAAYQVEVTTKGYMEP